MRRLITVSAQKRRINQISTFQIENGESPVEKHARDASFNNSEGQSANLTASNQEDLDLQMENGKSPDETHARDASFNTSESQSEITKASNQNDLDLSDEKEI